MVEAPEDGLLLLAERVVEEGVGRVGARGLQAPPPHEGDGVAQKGSVRKPLPSDESSSAAWYGARNQRSSYGSRSHVRRP